MTVSNINLGLEWLAVMADFVGRTRELALFAGRTRAGALRSRWRAPRALPAPARGRRRVGKSRLVETFVERGGARPPCSFTATGAVPAAELLRLAEDAPALKPCPSGKLLVGPRAPARLGRGTPACWRRRFPTISPPLVVLDEVPYLMGRDDAFEGVLQRSWDRLFRA